QSQETEDELVHGAHDAVARRVHAPVKERSHSGSVGSVKVGLDEIVADRMFPENDGQDRREEDADHGPGGPARQSVRPAWAGGAGWWPGIGLRTALGFGTGLGFWARLGWTAGARGSLHAETLHNVEESLKPPAPLRA